MQIAKVDTRTSRGSKLSNLRKVLITGWMTAIVIESIALLIGDVTLFIVGWAVSGIAGICTIAARKNGKI